MRVNKYLSVIIGLALLCAACGGGSSGSSSGAGGSLGEVPINDSNLAGNCAFSLLSTATPGALMPDSSSTVLAGVWVFDGKGNVSGSAAANGPSSDGQFATLTGTYNMTPYGTGTIAVTQAGQSYNLSFTVNEFLDELSVIGVSGSNAVIGGCNL